MRKLSKARQREVDEIVRRGKQLDRTKAMRKPFPPAPRRDVKALMASDAHQMVEQAIERGRPYLYVDGLGRIRDVRHDADVAALPPRPEKRPIEELDNKITATPPVNVVPTVLDELRTIIDKATRLVMQLGG